MLSTLNSKRYAQLPDVVFISNVISYQFVSSDLDALQGIVSFLDSSKIVLESIEDIDDQRTPKTKAFLKLLSDFMGSCSEEGLRFIDDFLFLF